MGKNFLPSIFLSLIILSLTPQPTPAVERSVFEITKEGTINAQAANAQLQDLLRNFSFTFNVEVRGIPAATEAISINLSRATFDETLKRLLRGYNYVLIQDEPSKKPAVVILGKAERAKYVDEPSPMQRAAVPSAPPPPPPRDYGTATSQPGTAPPMQASAPPRKTGLTEQQKKQDDPLGEAVVASSVRPGRTLRSDVPPMPPQIPGLELPPMPPSLSEARGSTQTVALDSPPQIPGENSSGQATLETPPEIPTNTTATQQKPKPKVDLKDLAPPSIPF